jgi:hypothetical protein
VSKYQRRFNSLLGDEARAAGEKRGKWDAIDELTERCPQCGLLLPDDCPLGALNILRFAEARRGEAGG